MSEQSLPQARPLRAAGLEEPARRRVSFRGLILGFTIVQMLLLVSAIVLVTSMVASGSRASGREVQRELAMASRLEQMALQQNLFRDRWASMAELDPDSLPAYAARYGLVLALLPAELRGTPLEERARRFASTIADASSRAGGLSGPERQRLEADVRRESDAIAAEARRRTRVLRESGFERLHQLERRTAVLQRSATGIAVVVAILSLGFASFISVRFVRPMEQLNEAVRKAIPDVSGAPRLPVAGHRETATLTVGYNALIDAIAEAQAELRRVARTDDLTSMANFRAFREQIEREIRRADRYQHDLGLLIFDLDRFKRYNDTYGHQAGNEALSLVAATIRGALRDGVDLPARYGGEEFAALVPETDAAGLHTLAERIRAAIEAIPPIGDRTPLTVSIGGAIYPHDGGDADSLFKVADARLYEAKETGRNRVVVPAPAPAP